MVDRLGGGWGWGVGECGGGGARACERFMYGVGLRGVLSRLSVIVSRCLPPLLLPPSYPPSVTSLYNDDLLPSPINTPHPTPPTTDPPPFPTPPPPTLLRPPTPHPFLLLSLPTLPLFSSDFKGSSL